MSSQKNGGIALSYVNTALNMCMNFALIPLLIASLTDDNYSLYKVMQSFAGPLMMFNLGMSTVVTRCIARYKVDGGERKKREKENTFALAVLISLGTALIVMLLSVGLLQVLPVLFGGTYSSAQIEDAKRLLLVFSGTTALHIVNDTFRGCVLGRERFYFYYGSTSVRYILRFSAICVVASFTDFGVVAIALVDLVVYAVLLLANVVYCSCSLRERMRLYSVNRRELVSIASFSLAILLQTLVNQVNDSVDIVILGALVTDKATITMYSSALSIYSIYNSLISVFASAYLPKATHLVTSGATGRELTDFVIAPGRVQACIAIAILGAFGLFGQTFIDLWLGERYHDAYWVALALMIPVTIPLVQNVCLSILNAKLKQLFRSVVLICMAIANVVISIALVKQVGYWGAAIGTVLSLIVGHVILMNMYYAKSLGIEVLRMFRGIFSGVLPAGFLSFLICLPLSRMLNRGVIEFVLGCMVFLGIYAFSLWSFGLNEGEKRRIRSSIERLFEKGRLQ